MKRRQVVQVKRNLDIPMLSPDATLEQVIEVLNVFATEYNILTRSLSFEKNFDGFIARDVVIAAGATSKVQHFLGVKPQWRVIFTQQGNGVITDIPAEWDDKVISIKNNGAEQVTLTLFIAKE